MGDTDVLTLRSGRALHYGKYGAGPMLMLLHGSPGSGRVWAPVIKHLPADLRILTPDLPGYGDSDPLAQSALPQTAAVAAAIAELIDHCAEPVWLCGHSYGGNVALHVALQRREWIRGLALIEPVFMRALDLADQSAARNDAEAFFTSYLVRAELAEPDAIGLMIDFWTGKGTYAGLTPKQKYFLNEATAKNTQDVRASFAETVTAEELRAFNRPVTISTGELSPPLAGLIANALAGLLPRTDLSVVPRATHAMLDTHPAEVAAFIASLCRSRVPVS